MINPLDLLLSVPNTSTSSIFDDLIEHIIIVFDKSMTMCDATYWNYEFDFTCK